MLELDRFTVVLGIVYFLGVVLQGILTATVLPKYPFTAAVSAEGAIFGLHYYKTAQASMMKLRHRNIMERLTRRTQP